MSPRLCKPRPVVPCAECGQLFVVPRGGRNKCCSLACVATGRSRRHAERWVPRLCAVCGQVIPRGKRSSGGGVSGRVTRRVLCCSRACGVKLSNARRAEINAQLKPIRALKAELAEAKRAAKRAVVLAERQRKADERAAREVAPRVCRQCGETFTPKPKPRLRRTMFYCTNECREDAKAVQRHHDRQRFGRKNRERAKHYGVEFEHGVTQRAVFERDKWTCQLCHRKTPKRLKGTNDLSAPELDHIVPMSQGGPHTWANVQCLCRKCNGLKAATTRGQLRLAFAGGGSGVEKLNGERMSRVTSALISPVSSTPVCV